ncbi:hypothetical protein GX48_04285 [Paracoccidioides brasiliensis]|nr:hypothetical protein GX48_04285 [Paracoccidioides brasiliensis]
MSQPVSKEQQQRVVAAAASAPVTQQSDNIAHALAGAGGVFVYKLRIFTFMVPNLVGNAYAHVHFTSTNPQRSTLNPQTPTPNPQPPTPRPPDSLPLIHSSFTTPLITPHSYPLITLSTRAQVESTRTSTTTLSAVRHILAREGFRGLYAGLESALFGISVTNFVYYYWYEWTRSAFEKAAVKAGRASKKLTTAESMIAGAIAGSATVLLTNPIWVVNTRMTAGRKGGGKGGDEVEGGKGSGNGKPKPKSTLATLMELLRTEGPTALFSGVLPALILVINPILQYTFFEQLKNVLEKRRRITPTDAFYLGALGKLLATSITYPYITVKSRMHVAGKGKGTGEEEGRKASLNETMMGIVREEGWGGLYKGIGPKVSQSVLTAAFLFAFKDVLYDSMVALRRRSLLK